MPKAVIAQISRRDYPAFALALANDPRFPTTYDEFTASNRAYEEASRRLGVQVVFVKVAPGAFLEWSSHVGFVPCSETLRAFALSLAADTSPL